MELLESNEEGKMVDGIRRRVRWLERQRWSRVLYFVAMILFIICIAIPLLLDGVLWRWQQYRDKPLHIEYLMVVIVGVVFLLVFVAALPSLLYKIWCEFRPAPHEA